MSPDLFPSHVLLGGSRARLVRYRPGECHPPHAHGFTSFTLVLGGAVEERMGSEVQVATACSVAVKPSGVEHADRFGPTGAVVFRVELSDTDEAWTVSSGRGGGRWQWIHAGEISRVMIRMLRALRGAGGVWSDSCPVARSSLKAAAGTPHAALDDILIEAIGLVPTSRPEPRGTLPPWLERVRNALAEDSTPVRSLAEGEGVHPVVLARLFRLRYGASPTEYRRKARVRRAAALLTDTRRPLVDVALEAGYCDQPHLTRDLRSVLGTTPGTVRLLATLPR